MAGLRALPQNRSASAFVESGAPAMRTKSYKQMTVFTPFNMAPVRTPERVAAFATALAKAVWAAVSAAWTVVTAVCALATAVRALLTSVCELSTKPFGRHWLQFGHLSYRFWHCQWLSERQWRQFVRYRKPSEHYWRLFGHYRQQLGQLQWHQFPLLLG